MSHEDVLLIVGAIHRVAWSVMGVVIMLAIANIDRSFRGSR